MGRQGLAGLFLEKKNGWKEEWPGQRSDSYRAVGRVGVSLLQKTRPTAHEYMLRWPCHSVQGSAKEKRRRTFFRCDAADQAGRITTPHIDQSYSGCGTAAGLAWSMMLVSMRKLEQTVCRSLKKKSRGTVALLANCRSM